jgi:hypothetical protein
MKALALLFGVAAVASCSFPNYLLPSTDGGGGTANGHNVGGATTGGTVTEPACDDDERNGTETDVDCGGPDCRPCEVGQRCDASIDCDVGACVRHECQAPTCRDGLQNALETDVDCGGDECAACGVDQGCETELDCDNLACTQGKCQPAGCSDGIWNHDETDLDCGGSCPECADELRCQVASDCSSGVCPKQTLRCAVPTCDDDVLNGSEPTLDCGADCSQKCQLLDTCAVAADCETGRCEEEMCLPSEPTGQALSPAGWIATASHTFGNSSPQYAIDGIKSTDWTTGEWQVPGMWFDIDMLSDQVFFSLEIDCVNARDDSAVAVDVWLSRDGTFTKKALSNVAGADEMVLTFPDAQVARYIRISLAQETDKWWRMDEVRVKQ